ncbi:MAG: hypothetical protein IH863_06060 [Chloroflexi bacterium]|nr:hypothetical protein [Chloroflexota bacterium]
MFRRYGSVLDECLAALRAGEPIEHIAARYPRHATRLRSALTLAARVQSSPRVTPRAQAQEKSWRLVRERAHQLRMGSRRVAARRASYGAILKPAGALFAVLLLVSSFGGGLAYASQDAMPDSPLYRVKLATEDIHLWFVFDERHEAEILLDQSDQRIDEIRGMVSQGKAIPENVLGALDNRNQRAVSILQDRPEETGLRARILIQAQEQEDLLVALWQQVSDDARDEYTEAVASLHNVRLGGGAGTALVAVQPEDLLGGIQSISGQVQALDDGRWSIGGVVVNIDDRTLGGGEIVAGLTARVVVARSADGARQALSLIGGGFLDGPDTGAFVNGVVEEITSEAIRVGGTWFRFSDSTVQTYDIELGEIAQITIKTTEEGIVAAEIKPGASTRTSAEIKVLTFEGTIEGDVSGSTSKWLIGGFQFGITESTVIDASAGDVRDGARVQVEAVNDRGELQASRVSVLASETAAEIVTIIGTFDGFEDGEWLVSGLPVIPPKDGDEPEAGALISVETERGDGGDLTASGFFEIEATDDEELIRTQGTISGIAGDRWTLEFGDVSVLATAEIAGGEPGVGQRVLIWSERGEGDDLVALYVRVLDHESISHSLVDTVLPAPAP